MINMIVAYISIGVIISTVLMTHEIMTREENEYRVGVIMLLGVFWPLTVLMLMVLYAAILMAWLAKKVTQ